MVFVMEVLFTNWKIRRSCFGKAISLQCRTRKCFSQRLKIEEDNEVNLWKTKGPEDRLTEEQKVFSSTPHLFIT